MPRTTSSSSPRDTTGLSAGRLICFGHSYMDLGRHPYGAETYNGYSYAGDLQRYPELLCGLLQVDTSRRFLTTIIPGGPGSSIGGAGTALGGGTFPVGVVPEDCILEGVWYVPANTLTGANTNTRSLAVDVAYPTAIFQTYGFRQFNSGTNLVIGTPTPILSLSQGMVDNSLIPHSATGVYSIPPVHQAVIPPTAGVFHIPAAIHWVSAGVGTGIADPGGAIVFRFGGRYKNTAVSGSRLTTSGIYQGGWASTLVRYPNRAYGVEVNLSAAFTSGGPSLTCTALWGTIPSGSKIALYDGVSTTTVTTTADAAHAATTISITNPGVNIAQRAQGWAREPSATGYDALAPYGLHVLGWGINEATPTTPEETGYKETLRATVALASCPQFRAPFGGNQLDVNGGGTWAAHAQPAGGQFFAPTKNTAGSVSTWRGTVSGSPSKTWTIGPAYNGEPIDVFFLAQAGVAHGAQATITVDGATPPQGAVTINTSSACTTDPFNSLTVGTDGTTALAGTVSGTTTLTLTSSTGSYNIHTFDNLLGCLGRNIEATAGTGSIAKGTRISAITSTTVATLDTAGTNGTVTAVKIHGYVPMVKRLTGLAAGGHTVTITITGIDATDNSAELIVLGYGIEANDPTTPIAIVGTAKCPALPSTNTAVNNVNTNTQAVIAGTATNPNAGNSTEPALPASVFYVDIDTPLSGATKYFEGDGIHPNARGHQLIARAIYNKAIRTCTLTQLTAR